MDLLILRSLHVAGALTLFTALGAILLSGSRASKAANILHGISLIAILGIGGMMLGKPPLHQSWWMVKFGIWLFLGAVPALAKRKVLPSSLLLILSLAAGFAAAWLGIHKSF